MGVVWYRNRVDRRDFVQRRKSLRKAVGLPASLTTTDGLHIASCTVLDISDGGARLKLDEPTTVPDSLTLRLYGRAFRHCAVRWRSGREVGVQFSRKSA